jgi:hypothetical protein
MSPPAAGLAQGWLLNRVLSGGAQQRRAGLRAVRLWPLWRARLPPDITAAWLMAMLGPCKWRGWLLVAGPAAVWQWRPGWRLRRVHR